jgi:hypothetical protein
VAEGAGARLFGSPQPLFTALISHGWLINEIQFLASRDSQM